MPTIITDGAASAQGYGFAARTAAANYIEDVFSTYLYTGNGSTQTITNGIDLSTKGGMVWIKSRSAPESNSVYDTSRGANWQLQTDTANAQQKNDPNAPWYSAYSLTSFNTSGFSLGSYYSVNGSGLSQVAWTFRKQAKFFDVVTYTGNGANRTIAHSLGSVPGCIIVKRTSGVESWLAYHRSLGAGQYLMLNWADPAYTQADIWNNTAPTSTVFSLGTNSAVNASGSTYVAYLFAHDAGGFGAAGTDNVISCGSYTGNGSTGQLINLGYEPQWVLVKKSASPDSPNSSWIIIDNMRGWVQADSATLEANTSNAENAGVSAAGATSLDPQGFRLWNSNGALNRSGDTYIYIAIRRGPMKTPTSGTSVFVPVAVTGATGGVTMTTNFPADAVLDNKRNGTGEHYLFDRLRSAYGTNYLSTSSSAAEGSGATQYMIMDSNTTVINKDYATDSGNTVVSYIFRRAPGFFDVVCYTGTGSATTVSHNLGVAPEMMIVKCRDVAGRDWHVYHSATGASQVTYLNSNTATTGTTAWNSTSPTSSVFSLGSSAQVNASGSTYVAYLFATVPGVSKVGSYSGSGTTKQIDCGFTNGARFVLIKRVNSGITSDWYVWDSARGIVAGNDPYLLLNSTAAEVTSTDYIDTYSAGFEISSTAPAAINANGISYIFMAVS